MSEDDWVGFAKSFEVGPPMPWFNVHELNELESRSLYEYIKSLGRRRRCRRPTTFRPRDDRRLIGRRARSIQMPFSGRALVRPLGVRTMTSIVETC